jgi:hypothetical protein
MKSVIVKIPDVLLQGILKDLRRPHKHAYERVGFCYGKSVKTASGWIVLISSYQAVSDENYVRTKEVGARINSKAITAAIQIAYTEQCSLFHIHLHDFGKSIPEFSYDDLRSADELIPSVQSFVANQVHGVIVLSSKRFNSLALLPGQKSLLPVAQISSIGTTIETVFPMFVATKQDKSNRYSRQEFLGTNPESVIKSLRVGVVGLSGGGSHIVQQTAHIGFEKFVLADPQCVDDDSNLNRIVGATLDDANQHTPKFDVFKRMVKALHPRAEIQGGKFKWEEVRELLLTCDIIFGCLDTIIGRRDLENFCRRYFIPYIDIGMGVELTSTISTVCTLTFTMLSSKSRI